MYFATHDVKVSVCIIDFSRSKIRTHHFNFNDNEGYIGIDCDIVIGQDLIVQLDLVEKFKSNFLIWYNATLYMTLTGHRSVKTNITKRKIWYVVIHTE